MTLSFFVPFLHISKLNESPVLLWNLIKYKGLASFLNEMIPIRIDSLIAAFLFYLFIKHLSSKISLLIGSLLLITAHYLLLSSSFIYDHAALFIIASCFCLNKSDQSKHLFFSLFYLTVLYTFSAFITCIHYYGYNIPLFMMMIAPILCLFLLSIKQVYPSKTMLISLFPLNILPLAYLVHNPSIFSIPFTLASILLISTLFLMLVKNSYQSLLIAIGISLVSLFIIPKELIIPFSFIPIALSLTLTQLFYASKRPLPSRRHVLQHSTQPYALSLRFYNEYMHY